MDTLSFFETVLPETGPYYLVIFVPGRQHPAHISCASLQELADKAAEYDAKRGVSVYFACASYLHPFVEVEVDGVTKKKYRIEPNWNRAKSLWCDIDVGEDKAAQGKGYLTKDEAVESIQVFCQTVLLPEPMIVDSGGGIHCYWPLTKAIVPSKWQLLAGTFKAALQHFGVKADPSRTADFASILRPTDTHNKKGEPRRVSMLEAGDFSDPADFARILQSVVDRFHVEREHVVPRSAPPPGLNDDLIGHLPPPIPSSAVTIAEKCKQFAMIRDRHGDVGYEHWRGGAGIFKHTIEGAEMFHKWSQGDPRYDQYSTQVKVDTWTTGPTTCEFFEQANPGGCDGCPHKGAVKSPIILGRFTPEPEEQVIEVVTEEKKTEQITVAPLPRGYRWEGGTLIRYVKSKEGDQLDAFKFCTTLYYPYQRVRTEQGTFAVMLRAHLPDGRLREFSIDTANLAAPADLMKALAGKGEIFATTNRDSPMHHSAYLRDSLEELKRQAEEANTILHMGWQEDGSFLVGDRLYKSDGTMQRVLLGANAASCVEQFPNPKGTLEDYAVAVNAVYKSERMIPLQYAFAAGFGSVLSVFCEHTYHGLLLCLTGGDTGKGKTTVAKAALYGFGDAEKMAIGSQKFTINFPPLRMGAYCNLPVLLDEMTSIRESVLSDLAYMVAQGIDKGRAQMKNGVAVQSKLATWRLSAYLTANTNMYTILASHAANTQAEAARVLQISVDEYDIPKFADKTFVGRMLQQMADNSGCAGEAFVKYVVEHRGEVQLAVKKTMEQLNSTIGDERLRFYVNHAAATLIAAQINHRLGIAEFDLQALAKFSVQLIRRAAGEASETNNQSPEYAFARMLMELSPRIIQTFEMRTSKNPEDVPRTHGAPAGRYVLYDHRLYLSKADVLEWWHVKNRYDRRHLYDYLRGEGVLVATEQKVNLAQGTTLASTGAVPCIIVDGTKWANLVPVSGSSHLSVIPGGKNPQTDQKKV